MTSIFYRPTGMGPYDNGFHFLVILSLGANRENTMWKVRNDIRCSDLVYWSQREIPIIEAGYDVACALWDVAEDE